MRGPIEETGSGTIPATLPPATEVLILRGLNVEDAVQHLILRALDRTGNNRTAAAALLGIHVRTLRRKLIGMKRDGSRVGRK